jgi:hypothetical protein
VLGVLRFGKDAMKTIAWNFSKYPIQFLYVLFIIVVAQLAGVFRRFIQIVLKAIHRAVIH